jgi:hypothetical protein
MVDYGLKKCELKVENLDRNRYEAEVWGEIRVQAANLGADAGNDDLSSNH